MTGIPSSPAWTVDLDPRSGVDQSEESLTVHWADGPRETMRLHEYGRVYDVPGLYEEVVQRRLRCASPATVATALVEQVAGQGEDPSALALLDVGAGNGVVGEELRGRGVRGPLVGVDAEPRAEPAAARDRPGLYAAYRIGDLGAVDVAALVAEHGLNGLVSAGALGSGHVAASAIDAAWRAFPSGAWLALTAADEVLAEGDVAEYVRALRRGEHDTDVLHLAPFRHRLRMSGEPIGYQVLVARRR